MLINYTQANRKNFFNSLGNHTQVNTKKTFHLSILEKNGPHSLGPIQIQKIIVRGYK